MLLSAILFISTAVLTYNMLDRFFGNTKNTLPSPKGSLPLIGHLIPFSKNTVEYIRKSYRECGNAFQLKIFRKKLAIICDWKVASEFFKFKESDMSLYEVFSDNPKHFASTVDIIRKTVGTKFDEFNSKIEARTKIMMNRLENFSSPISINDEITRFVLETSVECFISLDLTEEFYDIIQDFNNLLNKVLYLTHFLPKWILKYILSRKLKSQRQLIGKILKPEIQRYRNDPNLNDSIILRQAVDHSPKDDEKLNDQEIADIIICILYMSGQNVASALSIALIDLAKNPDCYETLYGQIAFTNIEETLNNFFLDSCVNESLRLATNFFSLKRVPKDVKLLGPYNVKDMDVVVFCGPMLMTYECSPLYNPQIYNPRRYEDEKEPKHILTWGQGVHFCPGKLFSLYLLKLAIKRFLENFECPRIVDIGKVNYFSSPTLINIPCKMKLIKRITDPVIGKSVSFKQYNQQQIQPLKAEKILKNLWVIEKAYTEKETRELYSTILKLTPKDTKKVKGTSPSILCWDNLEGAEPSKINPFCVSELLYTKVTEKFKSYTPEGFKANSLCAHMFNTDTKLPRYKDELSNWSISISLGATAYFGFTAEDGTMAGCFALRNGDVVIGDFGKVPRSIYRIFDDAPDWVMQTENFEGTRMCIEFRDVSKYKNEL